MSIRTWYAKRREASELRRRDRREYGSKAWVYSGPGLADDFDPPSASLALPPKETP